MAVTWSRCVPPDCINLLSRTSCQMQFFFAAQLNTSAQKRRQFLTIRCPWGNILYVSWHSVLSDSGGWGLCPFEFFRLCSSVAVISSVKFSLKMFWAVVFYCTLTKEFLGPAACPVPQCTGGVDWLDMLFSGHLSSLWSKPEFWALFQMIVAQLFFLLNLLYCIYYFVLFVLFQSLTYWHGDVL